MIRINLLKNLGLSTAGALGEGELTVGETRQQIALKAVVLVIPMILLMAYEKIHLDSLTAEAEAINVQVKKIESSIGSFGQDAPKVAEYKLREKKVEDEKKIISELSNRRLKEVKALDALQNVLPDRSWYELIDINDGKVKLQGYTLNEHGADELVKSLSSSVFFSDVELRKFEAVDINGTAGKKYELEFNIGKRELTQ
jgi:Tfp pilus assembly protein PilN